MEAQICKHFWIRYVEYMHFRLQDIVDLLQQHGSTQKVELAALPFPQFTLRCYSKHTNYYYCFVLLVLER